MVNMINGWMLQQKLDSGNEGRFSIFISRQVYEILFIALTIIYSPSKYFILFYIEVFT